MSHCTLYPHEHKMVAYSRRSSTLSEAGSSTTAESSSRRPSLADTHRRTSLASSFSLRLTKSKKSQSSSRSDNNAMDTSRLGALFFNLPPELQSHILSYLPVLTSLYNLRLTSRTTLSVLHLNAPDMTRNVLHCLLPQPSVAYIQQLYPPPPRHNSTNYLLQMLHRHHAIQNTLAVIVAFIRMKLYMIRTIPRVEHFGQYKEKLAQKLYTAAWTTWHYIEKHRDILLLEHPKHHHENMESTNQRRQQHPSSSRFWPCPQCTHATSRLVSTYPPERILEAYHFYTLLLSHLRASSRAPTYAGSIERALRRWSKKPPSEEELSIIVIIGGVERMAGRQLSVMKGTLNSRLECLGEFVEQVETAGATNIVRDPILISTDHGQLDPPLLNSEQKDENEIRGPMEITSPLHLITPSTLDLLPHLDDFLTANFERRIIEEDLLSQVVYEGVDESEVEVLRNSELEGPYGWVKRLMMGIERENSEEERLRRDGEGQGSEGWDEDGGAGAEGEGAM